MQVQVGRTRFPATGTEIGPDDPDDARLRKLVNDNNSNRYDAYQKKTLLEVLTPVVPEPPPLYPSPLSLPEAIDYLNAIWRLHAGKALIRIGRAEAAAKLVLDCANADEFESRLSAVCSILDAVDVPDRRDRKLLNLSEYLQTKLTEESAARALEAVDDRGRCSTCASGASTPAPRTEPPEG